MKRLVSILLLVFGVTTGFAQSSTPDYIQKAKVGLNQYYPQFKDYFEPIFKAYYEKLDSSYLNIINNKIQENFEIFEEELATDRDKCATILTSLEILMGEKTFRDSKKQIDSSDGGDLINGIANEIAGDINFQLDKRIQNTREEAQKIRKRNERMKEILKEISNITVLTNKNRETTEKIAMKLEEVVTLYEVSDVQDNSVLQDIIKQYIDYNNQINRHPSPLGQKFIDEYNRITKSK